MISTDSADSELLELVELQQEATKLFLLHWAAQDFLSAAASTGCSVRVDGVHESRENPGRTWLKYLFIGGLLGEGIAFLVVVPLYWLTRHWRSISAHS